MSVPLWLHERQLKAKRNMMQKDCPAFIFYIQYNKATKTLVHIVLGLVFLFLILISLLLRNYKNFTVRFDVEAFISAIRIHNI